MREFHIGQPPFDKPLSDREARKLRKRMLDEHHFVEPVLGGRWGEDTIIYRRDGSILLVYLNRYPGVRRRLKECLPALRAAATWNEQQQLYSGMVGFSPPTGRNPEIAAAFNSKHPDHWEKLQRVLIRKLDRVYRDTLQRQYAIQSGFADSLCQDYRIKRTCSTTGTANREAQEPDGKKFDSRFPCHRHDDNLACGMNIMTCWRDDGYRGGYLVLPQWKIAINMQAGDVLLFDGGADWHGNSPFFADGPYERITLVLYFLKKLLRQGRSTN
jgi:hypothetical protein